MSLQLWKPYQFLKDSSKPLIFNEIEQYYDPMSKSYRPFVIFYDDKNDCYYYLKCRTKTNFNNKLEGIEVLVPKSNATEPEAGLLFNDSYVDCTQIFKINGPLLESLVDMKHVGNFYSQEIADVDKKAILDTMFSNIMQVPPNLSIIEVSNKNNFLSAESLYLSPKKCEEVKRKLEQDIYPAEYAKDIEYFKSEKNDKDIQSNNRYNAGIKFCETFLNEYFPEDIQEFRQIQNLPPTGQGGFGQC